MSGVSSCAQRRNKYLLNPERAKWLSMAIHVSLRKRRYDAQTVRELVIERELCKAPEKRVANVDEYVQRVITGGMRRRDAEKVRVRERYHIMKGGDVSPRHRVSVSEDRAASLARIAEKKRLKDELIALRPARNKAAAAWEAAERKLMERICKLFPHVRRLFSDKLAELEEYTSCGCNQIKDEYIAKALAGHGGLEGIRAEVLKVVAARQKLDALNKQLFKDDE